MTEHQSETQWLNLLKDGNSDAATPIWQRYFQRLLGLARKKLATGPNRVADEEDVAISAFHSFCRGAAKGNFAQLEDRHDLWQVLALLTNRKAIRQLQRERAQKRGGGAVRGESVFRNGSDAMENIGIQHIPSGGPTPEYAALVEEELKVLLNRIDDESLREIAMLKLEGYTNLEIAEKLDKHVRSIERKLQLIRKHWDDE
jgi:DNA-directed RNA polymerase specialized sigma24 family protein